MDKANLGHTGVHMNQFNSPITQRKVEAPRKEATTFYYQSDGTGRDSYVLKHNGGLRVEYNNKLNGDRVFRDSLRAEEWKNFGNIKSSNDSSDITNYLNWTSNRGRHAIKKMAKTQKDLVNRLTTGSPNRETTIKYKIGSGVAGEQIGFESPTYQGFRESYKGRN